jgi:hypothetical protein
MEFYMNTIGEDRAMSKQAKRTCCVIFRHAMVSIFSCNARSFFTQPACSMGNDSRRVLILSAHTFKETPL